MNSVCCPQAPQRGLKKAKWLFFILKIGSSWRKSATKFRCAKTFSSKSVKHSLASLTVHKRLVGTSPCTWKFGPKWPTLFKNSDFQSIFAHSASTVTPSDKVPLSLFITNRKSTVGFPMSLRWTAYIAPKPSEEGFNNAKLPFFVQKWIYHAKDQCFQFSVTDNVWFRVLSDPHHHPPVHHPLKTDPPCSAVSLR